MFICRPCLDEHFDNWAPLASQGRCEMCRVVRHCADIHHSKLNEKPKPTPESKFQVTVFRTVREKHVVQVTAKNFTEAAEKGKSATSATSRREASERLETGVVELIHPSKGKNG